MLYAYRVKKDKHNSVVFSMHSEHQKIFKKSILEVPYITKFIPGVGVGGLLEVSSFFLIATIIIDFVNWKSEQMLVNDILQGSSAILSVCLVISLAGVVWQQFFGYFLCRLSFSKFNRR